MPTSRIGANQGTTQHSGGVKKSCASCPSLLSNASQSNIIGKSIGAPVCGLKLLSIGRPGLDREHNDRIAVQKASKCDSYGVVKEMDRDAKKKAIAFDVALPVFPTQQNRPEAVSSCTSCENYLPAPAVKKKTGWNAGMCRAKGQLLLDERLSMYARGCNYRSFGDNDKAMNSEIHLFPEFQDGWGTVDPMRRLAAFREKNGDPFTYPGDKPVSDKAKSIGVRAWRKIEDPQGHGPDIFLPIFDHLRFSPDELAKIPRPGDDERPDEYVDYTGMVYRTAVFWTRLGMTPALWGEPGTGKTEFFRHMAYLMALPFERLSITGSTELEYLEGKMLFSPEKGTYFQMGRVPQAWAKPNVFCIDEANLGQPPVWQFLRPLTDNSKQLVLDANKGERINAHPGCYLGFAMNPAWDPRNVGAMELGAADGSRLMHMFVPMPPRNIELNILMNNLTHDRWDEAAARKAGELAIDIVTELRKMSKEGSIPATFGVRDTIKFVRAMKYFDPRTAASVSFADALDPELALEVLDAVNQFVD